MPKLNVRSIFILSSGAFYAQLISIILSPLTAKLYGADAFGLQSLYMTYVNIAIIFIAVGLQNIIIIQSNNRDFFSLVATVFLLSFLSFLILILISFLFNGDLINYLNIKSADGVLLVYLLPLSMYLSMNLVILNQIQIKIRDFSGYSKVLLLSTSLTALLKIFFGYVNPMPSILIFINLVGSGIGIFYSIYLVNSNGKFFFKKCFLHFNISSIYNSIKCNKYFIIFRTPQNIINYFSQISPIIFLSQFSDIKNIGYYAIAIALLSMPVAIFGAAIINFSTKAIVDCINSNPQPDYHLVKCFKLFIYSGLPIFFLIHLISVPLFKFLLGEDWIVGGEYVRLLSMWMFFQYITRPLVVVIVPLNLNYGMFLYEIFSTLFKLVGLFVGFQYYASDILGLLLFSMSASFSYVWLVYFVLKRAKNHVNAISLTK